MLHGDGWNRLDVSSRSWLGKDSDRYQVLLVLSHPIKEPRCDDIHFHSSTHRSHDQGSAPLFCRGNEGVAGAGGVAGFSADVAGVVPLQHGIVVVELHFAPGSWGLHPLFLGRENRADFRDLDRRTEDRCQIRRSAELVGLVETVGALSVGLGGSKPCCFGVHKCQSVIPSTVGIGQCASGIVTTVHDHSSEDVRDDEGCTCPQTNLGARLADVLQSRCERGVALDPVDKGNSCEHLEGARWR